MSIFGKILLGFFVGLLCGLIPLIYGILTAHRTLGIVGAIATSLTGILFSILEKSPFTALVVAALFILFSIANKKRHSHNDDEFDSDLT